MSAQIVRIGRIKVFDPANKRGVITRQNIESQRDIPEDLYFEVTDEQALRLRVGQLVRFAVQGSDKNVEATDICVLSELA